MERENTTPQPGPPDVKKHQTDQENLPGSIIGWSIILALLIHICIYIYVYIYIHMYECVYTCVHIHVCKYILCMNTYYIIYIIYMSLYLYRC